MCVCVRLRARAPVCVYVCMCVCVCRLEIFTQLDVYHSAYNIYFLEVKTLDRSIVHFRLLTLILRKHLSCYVLNIKCIQVIKQFKVSNMNT